MLTIEKLTKQYPVPHSKGALPYKKALGGVSFTLSPGLYGLLGPNGAGKSTLINIITGSLSPTEGKVLWDGKSTAVLGGKFRDILGYMPQQQNLYDSFTGLLFLQYLAALKEIKPKDTAAEVERVAALVHLTAELPKKLSAYSGGMKQRLLAAAALMGAPKLIIMDEPTAGLDPKERVRLREVLAELGKSKIVLVATHVVSDVESVADEIILLKHGEIVDKASPAALCEKYKAQSLEDVYLSIFGADE
ncbi:MAG: ATP-binding cassette domain-containing protein [Oscillospiraceae bacterium]